MVKMDSKAQDALEYLLLISASILIVAIIISFIGGVLPILMGDGDKRILDYTCVDKGDSNSFLCGCYLCDKSKMGINDATNKFEIPTSEGCHLLANKLNQPSLNACGDRLSD